MSLWALRGLNTGLIELDGGSPKYSLSGHGHLSRADGHVTSRARGVRVPRLRPALRRP